MKSVRFIAVLTGISMTVAAGIVIGDGYHLTQRIPVPGDYGWDYMTVDAAARRLYVSHEREVVVIDADTHAIVRTIPVTKGAHGIAIAQEFGKGFISKTDPGSVTVFDTKTLKPLDEVRVGDDPNSIIYDPSTKRVFTADRGSKQVSAIEAKTGKVVGTIGPLGGKVEFMVGDEAGHVFINMQDLNTVLQLDARELKVLQSWPVAPCAQPTGIAMDRPGKRLFIGCRSGVMSVVNAVNGQVVSTLPIGRGVDATTYDPGTHLVFNSNGDGTLTVVKQDSADQYRVVENVATQATARTMAIDLKTHKAFLAAAQFETAPAAAGGAPPRRTMRPGSFTVLVLAP